MICNLLKKYEELIMYAIFGILTTLVNIIIYYIFTDIFKLSFLGSNAYLLATIIAWTGAVLFAFYTNKYFVFKKKEKTNIIKEMISFFSFRGLSLLFDIGIMFIMVELLTINDLISKVVANIIVILLNYFFSKLFIFKK